MASRQSFSAQVDDWVRKTKGATKAVYTESVQDVIEEAQTNAPVDTSFLVNSLHISTEAMPPIKEDAQPEKDKTYVKPEISASIVGAGYGSTLYVGYTAAYSLRIENGFDGVDSLGRYYRQAPQKFVGRAVQNWNGIVQRNIRRLSAKVAFS
ncbi:HK97 gp10 family phage protein [Pararhizobium mangrovi]|uniref:HK97 gp10 family phage protein n=1 Tax=Pararhizobium mangrovi TaxID=2590452 RepID=A0A506TVC7_9HYPH|nr:HK97 gp10 family phage protein [Pararhizobium mangrovi]TPW26032.1 HK97 gp10 family phage protein [Pararhizobium mangrovi]